VTIILLLLAVFVTLTTMLIMAYIQLLQLQRINDEIISALVAGNIIEPPSIYYQWGKHVRPLITTTPWPSTTYRWNN